MELEYEFKGFLIYENFDLATESDSGPR